MTVVDDPGGGLARRSKSTRGQRWLLVAVLALIAVWLVAPASTPVYDGIRPDEPYRYVDPPPGAKQTPPPTNAVATLRADGGRSLDAGYANSGESGPQISLYIPALALAAPTTARTIKVEAVPLARSAPEPTDGRIVTNVYRISAGTTAGPAMLDSYGHDRPSLQMRAPTGRQPGPVFEHRTRTGWARVDTIRVGVDIYQGSLTSLGDWALVQLTASPPSSGPGINWALLAGGVALLLVAGLVVAVRLRRSSSETA
jgi:hypothetical protein